MDSGRVVKLLLPKSRYVSDFRFPMASGRVDNLLFLKFISLSDFRFPIDSGRVVNLLSFKLSFTSEEIHIIILSIFIA